MPRRHADFGKLRRILVLIDGDIASLPIGERRGARGNLNIQHAANDDRVGMTLDDILDLAIDRGQRVPSSGTPEARVIHRAPAKRSAPFRPPLPVNRSAISIWSDVRMLTPKKP